ncbi:MAG: hypothetical protein HQL28_06295 [Candidatus Omnitrophica bacterium]|nr:hypothetical protein [Candidatus Omnitrophota bacterium]
MDRFYRKVFCLVCAVVIGVCVWPCPGFCSDKKSKDLETYSPYLFLSSYSKVDFQADVPENPVSDKDMVSYHNENSATSAKAVPINKKEKEPAPDAAANADESVFTTDTPDKDSSADTSRVSGDQGVFMSGGEGPAEDAKKEDTSSEAGTTMVGDTGASDQVIPEGVFIAEQGKRKLPESEVEVETREETADIKKEPEIAETFPTPEPKNIKAHSVTRPDAFEDTQATSLDESISENQALQKESKVEKTQEKEGVKEKIVGEEGLRGTVEGGMEEVKEETAEFEREGEEAAANSQKAEEKADRVFDKTTEQKPPLESGQGHDKAGVYDAFPNLNRDFSSAKNKAKSDEYAVSKNYYSEKGDMIKLDVDDVHYDKNAVKEVVNNFSKDIQKKEIQKGIFNEPDNEFIKVQFNDVDYTDPTDKKVEFGATATLYAKKNKPAVVTDSWDALMGVPYIDGSYKSEGDAFSQTEFGTLGTPYTIRPAIRKEAIRRGY